MDKKMLNQCSVVLTRNCNLRCGFCYVKEAGYCESEKISLDNLKKIVDFCCESKVKYIFFTGGEPLLYPFLNDILIYIKKKEHPMEIAIASNGILFEDYELCKKLKRSGLDYVDISMKGKDSSEWIETTGFDGYYKQQKAIKNLSLLNMSFTCSMVINFENVYSFCDSVSAAMESGAKQFSFTFVIDNDTSRCNKKEYFEKYNPFKLIEAFFSQIDGLNSITKEWWIEYSFPLCFYTKEQLTILNGKLASPCQIHKRNSVTFDTQLNLLPCDMFFEKKLGKLGEEFNSIEDFVKLKDKNPYKKTIDEICQLPSDRCKDCQYLEDCFGGCPVLWKHYSFNELNFAKNNCKK